MKPVLRRKKSRDIPEKELKKEREERKEEKERSWGGERKGKERRGSNLKQRERRATSKPCHRSISVFRSYLSSSTLYAEIDV